MILRSIFKQIPACLLGLQRAIYFWQMNDDPQGILTCQKCLGHSKPELGIQVDVVVPGHPIDCIKQAIRQSHHFCEADRNSAKSVNYTLGSHERYITLHLYWTIVYAWEAYSCALSCTNRKGTSRHQGAIDVHIDMSSRAADISESQLSIEINVVVPGQPIRSC